MPFPEPVQGLVIRYSYLWRSEHLRGQEEGVKDRPCAVILVTASEEDGQVVTVLPVTHSPPADMRLAVEIPYATKERLRLDAERSWVVLFASASLGHPASLAYGLLPYGLAEEIRLKFLSC